MWPLGHACLDAGAPLPQVRGARCAVTMGSFRLVAWVRVLLFTDVVMAMSVRAAVPHIHCKPAIEAVGPLLTELVSRTPAASSEPLTCVSSADRTGRTQ